MENIENKLLDLLKLNNNPSSPVPAPLLLNASTRSGISQLRIYDKVIQREEEIFAATDPHREMYRIIIDEIIKEIIANGVVEISIPASAIIVASKGSDASGTPVSTVGTNTNIVKGVGVFK